MILLNREKQLSASGSILSYLAIGCTLFVLVLLGTRQFTSYDLGYHLAFGEKFFSSGEIVDHTPYIYTLPGPDTPAAELPEPGPGNWYDSEGNYRFPNANWLSQIFIYGFWSLGDGAGLNLLQVLIIGGLFIMLIVAMRKSRVPLYLISLTIMLIGLIINSRLNMRPELFGYLCLIAQYLLLAGPAMQADRPRVPSWRWSGAMIAIQLFFINLHSYFLLSIAITGTVLAEYLLYALKKRLWDKDLEAFLAYRQIITRLIITITAMVAVSFINPWGWRLVSLPFQTLQYMNKHGIGGLLSTDNIHPWDHIPELRGTFARHWPSTLSDYAITAMLIIAAAAIILQLAVLLANLQQKKILSTNSEVNQAIQRPRWAHLLMIMGMLFVGLQVRRNVGIAGLIITSSSVICLTDSCRFFLGEKFKSISGKLPFFTNMAVLFLSIFGGYLIFSGKIYKAEGLPTRFGLGLSNMVLPVGAADWLNDNAPEARVWTDFQTSSSLHFLTRPHKDVPILTNTWTYPPEIMAQARSFITTETPFGIAEDKYGIDAVMLRSNWSIPLHRQLGGDPGWKIVHVEGYNVLYLRADDKFGVLAAEHEIRPENFNADSFAARQVWLDPSFDRAILNVSDTFKEAGELDLAIEVVEAGIKYLQPDMNVWQKLLTLYDNRESFRRKNKDVRVVDDINRMKYVLEKILELDPDDVYAREVLTKVNRILSVIESFSQKKENPE